MTSTPAPWPSLEPAALTEAAGAEWDVRLLPEAASTNALATAEPRPGLVVVADHQTAGRGRLDRTWETPPGTSLTFTAVVDPGVPDERWPLLPLAVALAVASGVRRTAGVEPELKWPNDVLLGGRKVSGILLERVAGEAGPVALVGVGINVHQTESELAVPTAISLDLAGSSIDRTTVFGAVLQDLADVLRRFTSDPTAVLADYRAACATVGAEVEVSLPSGETLRGRATDLDDQGRLVVDGVSVGAGDVVHVRPR